MRALHPEAELIGIGLSRGPAPLGDAEQAELGPPVGEPARADIDAAEMSVEFVALAFADRNVAADAQAQPLGERLLIFAAAPQGNAEAGLGRDLALAVKGRRPKTVSSQITRRRRRY